MPRAVSLVISLINYSNVFCLNNIRNQHENIFHYMLSFHNCLLSSSFLALFKSVHELKHILMNFLIGICIKNINQFNFVEKKKRKALLRFCTVFLLAGYKFMHLNMTSHQTPEFNQIALYHNPDTTTIHYNN